MSGMLSVIAPTGNPRGKRRRTNKRRKVRHHRATNKRRRHRATNPSPRRRRRVNARHRRRNPSRRRHRNPLMGGGVVGGLVHGATLGFGAIAARLAANATNNLAFKGTMSGPTKIALEAGVGVAGFMALKMLKQAGLAKAFLTGAGIVVALDIYTQFIEGNVPAMLKDYEYGQLSNWAPQGGNGIAAYETGTLSGGGVYDNGIYS